MYAKRTDSNQASIVKALRKMGFTVFISSGVGNGFPDIVVGAYCKNWLFEIKDGGKAKSLQRLTNAENLFHMTNPV